MIRFVIIGLAIFALWIGVMRLVQSIRRREVDWTGVAFMIGFVVLAFYLRHLTGMG